MNVAELIELLGSMPPDLPVWQSGGGDPYCAGEINMVEIVNLKGKKLMGHAYTPEEWVELG